LIELLVVIGIIAILASILMPTMSKAKDSARGAMCLSNMRGIAMAMIQYNADHDGYYPTSYYYVNGANSSNGYVHWTGILESGQYFDANKAYVCPQHRVGGWAPTNFTPDRIADPPAGQVTQTAGIDDQQIKRLTYVANEILMPRRKYSSVNQNLVRSSDVANASGTILFAEYTDDISCLLDTSTTGGSALKTHRPTSGIKLAGGGVFDGEKYVNGTGIEALTAADAEAAISNSHAAGSAAGQHHIAYMNPTMHGETSSYAFADGHAEQLTLQETLDPRDFRWGQKAYSCPDRPTIVLPTP
jgi:prepilin-type processing-associated H-X9-DG protein